MRPIKLKMQAFGPYVKPTVLDFAGGLGDEKIFLIHGATGAGKTTILDAISYALYGETSGKTRDGKDMRSKAAPAALPTVVEFTFELGEKIFKAYRSPAQDVPKKRGGGSKSLPAVAELYCDGNLLAAKERAVNSKIEELIGFKPDQFRQVVLLPQGEFKKFLAADSDKRQEVLNVLFDSAPYKKIEDALAERAKIFAAQVETLKSRYETLDAQIKAADTDSIAEVESKLSAALKILDTCKKISDDAQARLADGKILAGKFADFNKTTAELNAAQSRLAEAEKNLAAAQTEYQRRDAQSNERKELEQRIGELQKIQTTLADLQHKDSALADERKKLSDATATFDDCAEKSKRYQTRLDELNAQKAKLAGADVQFERLKALSDRAAQRDALVKEISRRKNILDMEQEKLAIVTEKFTAAQIELNRLQIVHSAAHLATTLRDGEPCPVCGSLAHPAIIAEAIPSAAELQAAEKNLERLTDDKARQERTVNTTAGELTARENLLQDFSDVPDSATVKKFHDEAQANADALAHCLQRIENGNRCIRDNRAALDAAADKKNSATLAVGKIESAIAEAKRRVPEIYLTDAAQLAADLTAARKIFDELDAAWTTAQKKLNAAKEIRSAQFATAGSAQKNFDALQAELQNHTPPDLDSLYKNAAVADENYGAARDEKTKLDIALDTLKKNSSERDNLKQQLDAKTKIAEMWRRLSDVANATGKGESELKISFQRYFLATMFDEVVAEANSRLKQMSGGRYLFRMKDAGKTRAKAAGLNLEIFDEYTGALRPVETLSGGESFLASLSLALGLASVVQNNSGGIKLDTIFIDEGFGSLDAETLDDAIATIIDQSGGRLVGIISHVEELKNQLPVRLEVIKDKTGSTAEFKHGSSRD